VKGIPTNSLLPAFLTSLFLSIAPAAKTLDRYTIDVEGGNPV